MKLTPRQAAGYFARPDPDSAGLLIYGADAMRVALKRQEVIAALIGPRGEEEMRLTRIAAADLRKDPAMLPDAIKAQGFFPGLRVALVEDAADGLTKVISAALSDWRPGDAQVIVTARQLAPRSSLRKLFEAHPSARSVGIYNDPPDRAELQAILEKAGVGAVERDGMAALEALSRTIGPGDLHQLAGKLALYKLGDERPVSGADVEAVAPVSTEAALDDVLNVVAEGRTDEVWPLLSRLESQGVQPVSLCIGAARHFRRLHMAASDPGGVSSGIARLRPPVHGPRRDRMQRQAQGWGMARLERALAILTDTDLHLRSASRAPAMAMMTRTLLRLSMMTGRR